MEEKVSRQLLKEGQAAIGTDLLSVAVVNFTQGSYIADTRLAIAAQANTEALGSVGAALAVALSTADMSAVAPGASVLGISVGNVSLSNTTQLCDVFDQLYTCVSGSRCNDTTGTAQCYVIPTVPPTEAPTTPAEADKDNRDLIIGLSVGIFLFLILLVVVGSIVYYCSRKKRQGPDEQSSQASWQKSIDSGLPRRWRPDRRFPYAPDSFRDDDSSASGSTASGPTRGRQFFPRFKSTGDPFESPYMGKIGAEASAVGTPRAERAGPSGRQDETNANSNFSWEYMFNLLEPHVPLEIPRTQLKAQQSPATREGSGGFSSVRRRFSSTSSD
ncbi:fibrillin-1 [Elysia marginata]|uniref:Fibrillin-1 n=1 Tax=Elysia marginata TaxID=1093978 RepID=A0AAV4FTL8_9GAST|nr:fibrillin-1 [Elysia marginata]